MPALADNLVVACQDADQKQVLFVAVLEMNKSSRLMSVQMTRIEGSTIAPIMSWLEGNVEAGSLGLFSALRSFRAAAEAGFGHVAEVAESKA